MNVPRRVLKSFSVFVLLLGVGCSSEKPTAQLPTLPRSAKVLAFGDSLTNGNGATPKESYPAVLEKLIGRSVIRSGVPGEVSSRGLQRLPTELDRHRPQLLLLLHGGNDMLRRMPDEKTYQNLKQMVAVARSRRVPVVLVAVPKPSLIGFGLEPADFYIRLAEEYNLPIVKDRLAELLGSSSHKSDAIHLNAKGYRALAEEISGVLKDAGAIR